MTILRAWLFVAAWCVLLVVAGLLSGCAGLIDAGCPPGFTARTIDGVRQCQGFRGFVWTVIAPGSAS